MANRTVKDAKSVHGTNPQYLVEKIIRTRIYESRYWKEDCFGLSAELVVDKGAELRFIGGIYSGNIKPTPFLCLMLKMLQIQPEKDIIIEFIKQDSFKYVRALGAFYLRLTSTSVECWKYLEPLYNDFRKLRMMDRMGKFSVIHMDEFVDMLLRDERVFDVILPRISKRRVHEEADELEPRVSALEDDLDNIESEEEKPPTPPAAEEKRRGRGDRESRRKEKDRHHKDEKEKRLSESKERPDKDHERDRNRRHEDDRSKGRGRDERDKHRDKSDKRRGRSSSRGRSRTPERRRRSVSKEKSHRRRERSLSPRRKH
ncbi:Pre-mRNA-splicing factor 38A [Halotydeus destructor]|nr:Pre-mRNA-splicing factor 38A [Halotydeus destructor]